VHEKVCDHSGNEGDANPQVNVTPVVPAQTEDSEAATALAALRQAKREHQTDSCEDTELEIKKQVETAVDGEAHGLNFLTTA
jgi:hypothetical protein